MSSEERSPGADGDTSVESGVAVIAVAPARLPLSSLRTLSRQSQRSLAAAAPIPVIGISLDGILEFAELCWRTTPSPPSAADVLAGAAEGVTFGLDECSTEVVKRQWMLAATALPHAQSYCDLLKARRSRYIGEPTVFVSHAWRYRFLDVVAALENWLSKGGGLRGQGLDAADASFAALLRGSSGEGGGGGGGGGGGDGGGGGSPPLAGSSPRTITPKSSILSLLRRGKRTGVSLAEETANPIAATADSPLAASGTAGGGAGAPSLAVIKALRERTFFWFDIFSNSQHNTDTKPFEWWTEVFQSNVQRIGHTLLVLEWNNPIPLSRAWCIWEIFCTLNNKKDAAKPARLEIIMSGNEEETFNLALVEQFETVVKKVSNIDVARAVASVEADKNNIFSAISKTLGVNEVTRLVVQEMRSWVADAGRRQLLKVASDRRALLCGPLVLKYSRLLLDLGRRDEALSLAQEALRGRTEMLSGGASGDSNPELLAAVDHLAYLTFYRGYMSGDLTQMPTAQGLYERAIRGRRKVIADLEVQAVMPAVLAPTVTPAAVLPVPPPVPEPDKLFVPEPTPKVMAVIAKKPAPAPAAAPLHSGVLSTRRRELFTSLTFGGFSQFSGRSGNRALAIRLIDEAWAGWVADPEGDAHLGKHYCAWARAELLVFERHRLCDALQTAYVAFLQLQRLQGTLHPDTLYMMRLCSQGVYVVADYSTAIPTARDSSQLLSRVLGSDHPYARVARGNLSFFASSLGFLSEAEVLGLEGITQIQAIEGGPISWSTLMVYANALAAMRAKFTADSNRIYLMLKWEVVAAVFYLLDFGALVEIGRFLATGIFWPSSTKSKLVLPVLAGQAFYAAIEALMFPFVMLYAAVAIKSPAQAVTVTVVSGAVCVLLSFALSLPLQTVLLVIEWPVRALLSLLGCSSSSDTAASGGGAVRTAAPALLEAQRLCASRRRPENAVPPTDLELMERLLALEDEGAGFEADEAAAVAALAAVANSLHARAMDLDDCASVRRALHAPLAVLEYAIAVERADRAALFSPRIVAEACRVLAFGRWQTTLADLLNAVDALPALSDVLSIYSSDRAVRRSACKALRNAAQASIASKDALIVGGAVPALRCALERALAETDGDPETCVNALFALSGITAFNCNGQDEVRGHLPLFTDVISRHAADGATEVLRDLLHATKVTSYGVFENMRVHRDAGLAPALVRVLARSDVAQGGSTPDAALIVQNAAGLLWELSHEGDASREACLAAGAAEAVARVVGACGRDSHHGFPMEFLNEVAAGSAARAERVAAALRSAGARCG